MANLKVVLQKLRDLQKIKAERERINRDLSCITVPETIEEMAQSRIEQVEDISDKILGVTLYDEPQKPVMTEPSVPEKKTIKPLEFNVIMMLRPVAFAFVIVIQSLLGWDNNYVFSIYCVVWLIVWLFVGIHHDSFSFKGFWLGFAHIFKLFLLPKYNKDKKEVERYNSIIYPKMMEEYGIACEKAKKKYEEDCARYEKEMDIYRANLEKQQIERESIINGIVEKYVNENREAAKKAEIEYIEKTSPLNEKIAELDKKIQEYSDIDEEVLFNPNLYNSEDIEELIEIIERGRASSLKEAVNIKLDEDRKDNEERQRRMEADRMARIEEQKVEAANRAAEETRRHNMEVEYDQQQRTRQEAEYQRKQLENDQKQFELNRRQQEMESKAYSQQRYAESIDRSTAKMLCNHCKYYGGCAMRTNPPLHCSRFAEKAH